MRRLHVDILLLLLLGLSQDAASQAGASTSATTTASRHSEQQLPSSDTSAHHISVKQQHWSRSLQRSKPPNPKLNTRPRPAPLAEPRPQPQLQAASRQPPLIQPPPFLPFRPLPLQQDWTEPPAPRDPIYPESPQPSAPSDEPEGYQLCTADTTQQPITLYGIIQVLRDSSTGSLTYLLDVQVPRSPPPSSVSPPPSAPYLSDPLQDVPSGPPPNPQPQGDTVSIGLMLLNLSNCHPSAVSALLTGMYLMVVGVPTYATTSNDTVSGLIGSKPNVTQLPLFLTVWTWNFMVVLQPIPTKPLVLGNITGITVGVSYCGNAPSITPSEDLQSLWFGSGSSQPTLSSWVADCSQEQASLTPDTHFFFPELVGVCLAPPSGVCAADLAALTNAIDTHLSFVLSDDNPDFLSINPTGLNFSSYTHRIYVLPDAFMRASKCNWQSASNVYCRATSVCHMWLADPTPSQPMLAMVARELGNNWGLGSANAVAAPGQDLLDVMGASEMPLCYNGPHLARLGWAGVVDSDSASTIRTPISIRDLLTSQSYAYTLSAIAAGNSSVLWTSTYNADFWFSYLDADAAAAQAPLERLTTLNKQVVIHRYDSFTRYDYVSITTFVAALQPHATNFSDSIHLRFPEGSGAFGNYLRVTVAPLTASNPGSSSSGSSGAAVGHEGAVAAAAAAVSEGTPSAAAAGRASTAESATLHVTALLCVVEQVADVCRPPLNPPPPPVLPTPPDIIDQPKVGGHVNKPPPLHHHTFKPPPVKKSRKPPPKCIRSASKPPPQKKIRPPPKKH